MRVGSNIQWYVRVLGSVKLVSRASIPGFARPAEWNRPKVAGHG